MPSDALLEEESTLVAELPLTPAGVVTEVPALPAHQHTTGDEAHGAALKSDIRTSIRNAAKLGASLLATWAVALAVRVFMPRYLGPASFGAYQFADAFTSLTLIATTLGVETYIRKEVPRRPHHANEFFGGTVLVCGVLGALVLMGSIVALSLAGKSTSILWLVAVLGVATLLVNLNINLAAILHTVGKVNGLSVLNVVGKLVWGGGIGLALVFGDVHAVAVAVLASEVLRTAGLALLVRRAAGLRWRIDLRTTRSVLLASLPFYVGAIAQTVYASMDKSIMAFVASDTEVGWYGASQAVVGMALILSPLIGWVLVPLSARAAARSHDELLTIGSQALAMVSTIAFPVTLLLSLNADLAVQVMFGGAFAPAAPSLRLLAPVILLTYWTMLAAILLVQMGRAWAVTTVTLAGMAMCAAFNLLVVPRSLVAFGAGGAGIGAGASLLATEVLTAVALCWLVGRRMFTRTLVVAIGKTLGVCAAVAIMHRVLGNAFVDPAAPASGAGWARLGVDLVVYALLLLGVGGVKIDEVRTMIGHAFGRRGPAVPETA